MKVEREIRELKERVSELEEKLAAKGTAELAIWLLSALAKFDSIPVRRLKKMAMADGKSWQMVQKARRLHLPNWSTKFDEVSGWIWKKN